MSEPDLVVCVADDWAPPWFCDLCPRLPVKGEIFTIRARLSLLGRDWLRFEEIVARPDRLGFEPAFCAQCFRPVRSTDISALRTLLAPAPEKERVA